MRDDFRSSRRSVWTLSMALALTAPALAFAQYTPGDDPPSVRDQLKPHAQFLADLLDRPRRVIYTPYPVSHQHGLVHGFVHVTDGSAVLSRADLVVDSRLPIMIRRAYHSARSDDADFGATGWRLTLDERITRGKGGRLTYTYGNGRLIVVEANGDISASDRHFSDVARVLVQAATVEVTTRTGVLKTFVRAGNKYRLAETTDEFGNKLMLTYSPTGALSRIESSDGAWADMRRDEAGRIRRVRDSFGREVAYGYDDDGRLVTVTDPAGQVWAYGYDSANRLVSTTTPNGATDTEFAYDNKGRVKDSRANGMRLKFRYTGQRTLVTDSKDLTTAYRAHGSGTTIEVTNPLGTITTVQLHNGIPRALQRNNSTTVQLHETVDGRPMRADISSANGELLSVSYDLSGRAIAAASDLRGSLYSVSGYGAGLLPGHVSFSDGRAEQVQFTTSGDLQRFAGRDGTELRFQRTGNLWRVSDALDHSLELRFEGSGRLASAKTPYGMTLTFGYNDAGLRELTETSYGASVRYGYDASGSLFHSALSYRDRDLPAFTYVLGVDQRVDAVQASDGQTHTFTYDDKGLLRVVRQPGGEELRYDYDDRARLVRAAYKDQAPLDYVYKRDETDITTQLAYRTVPVFNQQREISDFGSRFDVALTRIKPASSGLLHFDENLGEFVLAADPARWNPMAPIARSLTALQLNALLIDERNGIGKFSSPANRLFVPREYWSVNCCICICADPNYTCTPE